MKAPFVRFACVVAVLVAASYAVVTFPGGVSAYRERQRQVSELEKRVQNMSRENQRMQDRIKRLGNDPAEQERTVKERLKYVHPGEKVFITGESGKK